MASLEGWTTKTKIALLVKNVSSLDAEEQAAYSTATAKGFSVTLIDPQQIVNNPGILNFYSAFWAHSGSEPTGYNNPIVINALKTEIAKGKKMLVSWFGKYLVQYLGLATVKYTGWWPAVYDGFYLVDTYISHPVFVNLPAWEPPSGPPDNSNQFVWNVNSGTRYRVWIDTISWAGSLVSVNTTYGWPHQTLNTALGREYGITPTKERNIYIIDFPIKHIKLGNGEIIEFVNWGWNGELTPTNGSIRPAGIKMLDNILKYITIPIQPTHPISYTIAGKVTTPKGSAINFVKVQAKRNDILEKITRTDSNGNYLFEGLLKN